MDFGLNSAHCPTNDVGAVTGYSVKHVRMYYRSGTADADAKATSIRLVFSVVHSQCF